MNLSRLTLLVPALASAIVAGCAAPGYSPPSERRAQDQCPTGQVWVCEDRYPSRIESENRTDPLCRCADPTRLP